MNKKILLMKISYWVLNQLTKAIKDNLFKTRNPLKIAVSSQNKIQIINNQSSKIIRKISNNRMISLIFGIAIIMKAKTKCSNKKVTKKITEVLPSLSNYVNNLCLTFINLREVQIKVMIIGKNNLLTSVHLITIAMINRMKAQIVIKAKRMFIPLIFIILCLNNQVILWIISNNTLLLWINLNYKRIISISQTNSS